MIGRIVASFVAAQKIKEKESKKKVDGNRSSKRTVMKTKKKKKFSDNFLKEL